MEHKTGSVRLQIDCTIYVYLSDSIDDVYVAWIDFCKWFI